MGETKNVKLSITELRERIESGEILDPIVFLESIMSGQDPRKLSNVYTLAEEIQDLTGGELEVSDWEEMLECIRETIKFEPVSLQESQTAAKIIAEYLHPKRKQVDVTGGSGDCKSSGISPLTKEELITLRDTFNDLC